MLCSTVKRQEIAKSLPMQIQIVVLDSELKKKKILVLGLIDFLCSRFVSSLILSFAPIALYYTKYIHIIVFFSFTLPAIFLLHEEEVFHVEYFEKIC